MTDPVPYAHWMVRIAPEGIWNVGAAYARRLEALTVPGERLVQELRETACLDLTLPEATNDTLVLVKAATHGVRKTWRNGYRYFKAGVGTTDLVPLVASQRAMPGLGQLDREAGSALMLALDTCNRRFKRGAIVPGATGFAPKRDWSTKFEMRSPRYTTRVDELPVVAAA